MVGWKGLLSLTFLVAQTNCQTFDDPKVVYGQDGRLDYYDLEPFYQDQMRYQTVSLMKTESLGRPNANGVYHAPSRARSLGRSQGLCSSERFVEQPAAAFCSGSLIGPDRVMTAGHCVSVSDCALGNFRIVFDFHLVAPNTLAQISTDDVYTCRRVFTKLDQSFFPAFLTLDYAIIQLDRPVRGRRPARAVASNSGSDRLMLHDRIVLVGYPSGIPGKTDPDGVVINTGDDVNLDYFMAAIDSFGGNSGSGVFNSRGDVVGILVRGTTDYVIDRSRRCGVVNVIPCANDDCSVLTRGESISYAATAVNAAPECVRDSDCDGSLAGSRCDRACEAGVMCCTGWCSQTSRQPNFNTSACESYLYDFNLVDVVDDAGDSEGQGSKGWVIAIVVVVLVTVIAVAALLVYRRRRNLKRRRVLIEGHLGQNLQPLGTQTSHGSAYTPPMGFAGSSASGPRPQTKPQPRVFPVKIPDNAEVGTLMRVTAPNGVLLEFNVPDGYKAGQIIALEY